MFSSYKVHVKNVHGKSLQVVLPVAPTLDGCDDGDNNMEKKLDNGSKGKAVENIKDEDGRNNLGKKDEDELLKQELGNQ
ncbi:hypothetical protein ACOMHN_064005 [Nucella lapillus]